MKIKKHIKKTIAALLWTVAGAGIVVLLIAAVEAKETSVCKGYKIDIRGSVEGQYFIDQQELIKLLGLTENNPIEGREISSIDLQAFEDRLRNNPWIKQAEAYIDNNNYLRIGLTERVPVARVFTTGYQSFYIDADANRLPLSRRTVAKVPVFTDYPDSRDSTVLATIAVLGEFIMQEEFWMAQIQQISILPGRKFELTPTVGNHIIEFGTADKYAEKFSRLMSFYQKVLARTGFDRYSVIKAQFEGQIVGVRREGSGITNPSGIPKAEVIGPGVDMAAQPATFRKVQPAAVVKTSPKKVSENKTQVVKQNEQKPKAVMPKANK